MLGLSDYYDSIRQLSSFEGTEGSIETTQDYKHKVSTRTGWTWSNEYLIKLSGSNNIYFINNPYKELFSNIERELLINTQVTIHYKNVSLVRRLLDGMTEEFKEVVAVSLEDGSAIFDIQHYREHNLKIAKGVSSFGFGMLVFGLIVFTSNPISRIFTKGG